MSSFYTEQELNTLGLKYYGKGVRLSRNTMLYGADRISIGDYSRIDDFCVLSGSITIDRYVHVAVYSALFGADAGIILDNCSTISSRCCVYAANDDYSGTALSSGAPAIYRKIEEAPVHLKSCSILGSSCVVLPGVTLNEGAAVGAMSLVNHSLAEWWIYAGVPCRKLKRRSQEMKDLAEQLLSEIK